MPARARVFARVAVGRAVAAQRRAALLTHPQMDPLRAALHALAALSPLRVFDTGNSLYMRASHISHSRVPSIRAALQVEGGRR